MKKTVLCAVATMVAGSAAWAGGPTAPAVEPVVQAPVIAAVDWRGAYAGGGLSYGSFSSEPEQGVLPDAKGTAAALIAGYNWQRGNLVYGIEGKVMFGAIDGSSDCANSFWTCESDVKSLASLRGRLGIANGKSLVYVAAGPSMGRVEHQTISGAGIVSADSATLSGYVVAVGLERVLNGGWGLRGEIEHYNLNGEDFQLDALYSGVKTKGTAVTIAFVRRF